MAIVHKAISAFNASPIKISRILFTDRTNNLWNNETWGKIITKLDIYKTLLYFRQYDKVTVIKTECFGQKNTHRHIEQWNRLAMSYMIDELSINF